MDASSELIVAMARRCRELILASGDVDRSELPLPPELRPRHLLGMCEQIRLNAADWPETKLHRWIGFIQCAMLANGVIDLDGAKAMFDEAKNSYRRTGADQDLLDHLDPANPFSFDLGGES